jgi:hypothetical protein
LELIPIQFQSIQEVNQIPIPALHNWKP